MVVMVVITVLLLGGLVAMQHVMGYLPIAKADEQRQAALAAAQAGVDDYVNRLNQDPDYWYGGYYNNGYDDAAATNAAMRTDPWGWVPVEPGSPAEYHYSVDTTDSTSYKETNSSTASWGTIYITSTGKVGNVTRTIQVGVRQSDFLSNLYLSNYNLVDPNLFFAMGDAPSLAAADDCVDYGYQANPDPPSPYSPATPSNPGGLPDPYFGPANPNNWSLCTYMINYWITGNVVNGPMQSEDDYYFSGTPVF